MNNPLVSVVIITRNRAKGLRRCIKSILNNTYKDIELVIFDNSSPEPMKRNEEFLSSLEFENIKYIKSSPKGFAEMRQIAIENSEGEIIMSIDDDCVAEKDAIVQMVRCFMSDGSIGIVGANKTNIGFTGKNKLKGRAKIGVNGRYELVQDPQDAEIFGNDSMSIRREAFDKVGGYDPFFSGGLEEADLTLSIKEEGYKIVYEPSVKITHFYTPTRFRPPGRNMEMHRLYLFFKHYMPSNITDWVKFFSSELKLLVQDINRLIPKSVSGKRSTEAHTNVYRNGRNFFEYLKVSYSIFRKLSKLIIARMVIPYLIYRACKARSQNEKRQHGDLKV